MPAAQHSFCVDNAFLGRPLDGNDSFSMGTSYRLKAQCLISVSKSLVQLALGTLGRKRSCAASAGP